MFKNIGFFVFLFKMGPLFMKALKSAKMIKLALAGGSMAAYSYLFTWQFAIVLLASIIFHEYGHTRGMKHCGIPVKGIYLIPFLGGAAVPEKGWETRTQETHISLWGPLYGLILCIPFLVYGIVNDSSMAIGIVSFMALINLFNLFPINPLDGGRVVKSIAFSFSSNFGLFMMTFGMILAALGIYFFKMWILMFVLVIGGLELFVEYYSYKRQKKSFENFKEEYYKNYDNYLENLKETDIESYNNEIRPTDKEVIIAFDLEKDIEDNLKISPMNKQDIIRYSFFYVFLVVSFVGLIIYTASFEGANLALKMLQEDM